MPSICIHQSDRCYRNLRELLEREGVPHLVLQEGQRCLPTDFLIRSEQPEFHGTGVRHVRGECMAQQGWARHSGYGVAFHAALIESGDQLVIDTIRTLKGPNGSTHAAW